MLITVSITCFSYDLPRGWYVAGTQPDKYDMGIVVGAGQNGKNAATIQSVAKKIKGFGTLMQDSRPDKFLGKRVRMSGDMKSSDVRGWAGLWMRVDECGGSSPLSFDNMQDRKIAGNTEWKRYEIVLDVPNEASNIAFGALLDGTGQVWFENITFEIVTAVVPTTGYSSPDSWMQSEPSNLNFEEKY